MGTGVALGATRLTPAKLQGRSDPRLSAAQPDIQLSDDDMKEIMNGWRNDPEKWLSHGNVAKLAELAGGQSHELVERRFGTGSSSS